MSSDGSAAVVFLRGASHDRARPQNPNIILPKIRPTGPHTCGDVRPALSDWKMRQHPGSLHYCNLSWQALFWMCGVRSRSERKIRQETLTALRDGCGFQPVLAG